MMAKLTRGELMQINRQLKAQGRRICSTCYREHPLTEEYWYFYCNKTRVQAECRACRKLSASTSFKKRYKDASFRADYLKRSAEWRDANRMQYREISLKSFYRRRAVRVTRKLTAIYKGVA